MRKIIYILFTFVSVFVNAQEYKFNVYSQEEGLPQPYVYDIIQTQNGFLYVATGDGLASFGGYRFNKFTKRVGLSENYCSSLFSDSQYRIWIGHFEGGISCLENNKFRKINISDIQAAKIVGITEDSKKTIYYANAAGSIYTIKDDKVSPFIVDELPPINKIAIKGNVLFIASQEGLLTIDLNYEDKSYNAIGNTKDKNVTCIYFTRNNEIIAGIDGEGVEYIKQEGKDFKSLKTYGAELKSKRLNVKDVCIKNGYELWVSLNGEGLSVLKFNNDKEIDKQLTIGEINGLVSPFVSRLFVDKEDNLWIGTIGGGLSMFMSDRFELFNKNNFLKFDNVVSVAVDDNNIVYATDEKKLLVFNVKDSSNTLLNVLPATTEEKIQCSYLNKVNNELWVGTTANLFIYDVTNGKPKLKLRFNEFKERAVNYITKDNLGQTLVCTTEGLFYIDDKHAITKLFNTDNGAPHNNFNSVFVDQLDKYWIFSPQTPLYHLYNGEITLEKDLDSSTSFKFNCATSDKNDLVWFGTEGDGVFSYGKKRKPNYQRFTTGKGLASDFIYAIISSNNGDIVTCHKNGISIKYGNLKTFRTINKNNGLPANSINSNAVYKDKNGYIWLGSTEGLIKYSPMQDKINSIPPTLSFVHVSMNDSVLVSSDTLFEFPYGKYELSMEVIGVSLTNPNGVEYKYMLEGLEDKFRITDKRIITYPGLVDGTYRFRITAVNADGFATPNPITFKIVIAKPYWKSVWFYVVIVGAITIGFVLFFRARTRKLKLEKLRLEQMVNDKTKELVVEKERVEKANELLHEKNRDITDSITYAKRIQTAVLPNAEDFYKSLDLFVLFKPRDIVSGDFYWYYVTENYLYVAVVDCTGHGVPGAFMSLLGSAYLDQVLIENKEPLPSKILVELDKKIYLALRQANPDNKIGDGMDMCVCRIDKNKNEIIIASANRPIYYITEGTLQEIKANVYSIGGYFDDSEKQYTEISYNIKQGDVFYMFSDGYGDQFGGEKNRRFSTRKMKTIFGEIYGWSTNDQCKQLDTEFENWRGENEQIDDVCVIGIKF